MHEPLPLPPPDDEFDDSDVTAEVRLNGIDRVLDEMRAQRFDDLRNTNRQIHALTVEIREANAVSKGLRDDIKALTEAVGQLNGYVREIDQREQPRIMRGKRK